jgi:hypothetical protein
LCSLLAVLDPDKTKMGGEKKKQIKKEKEKKAPAKKVIDVSIGGEEEDDNDESMDVEDFSAISGATPKDEPEGMLEEEPLKRTKQHNVPVVQENNNNNSAKIQLPVQPAVVILPKKVDVTKSTMSVFACNTHFKTGAVNPASFVVAPNRQDAIPLLDQALSGVGCAPYEACQYILDEIPLKSDPRAYVIALGDAVHALQSYIESAQPLKLFMCADHDSIKPYQPGSVVVAPNREKAIEALNSRLREISCKDYVQSPFTLTEIDLYKPRAWIINLGEMML